MATFDYPGYDDDQISWPGGTPTNGDTITFVIPTDHVISITDNDSLLQDGTDDRDDEDSNQTAIVYDEFGSVETSGQVQPRQEIALSDGTNTYFMTTVFIAATNSTYYIFQDPPPELNVTYTVTSVTNPNSTNYSELSTAGIACFASGTLIRTPSGHRPVEALTRGDLVSTVDRGAQPILWIGSWRVSWTQMQRQKGLRPFIVQANTFAPGEPERDTLLSRQHRIRINVSKRTGPNKQDEVLAPVHCLTALAGVRPCLPPGGVRLFHFLTPQHDLIWSNGIETETLLWTAYSKEVAFFEAPRMAERLIADSDRCMSPARPILPNRDARAFAKELALHQRAARRLTTVREEGLQLRA